MAPLIARRAAPALAALALSGCYSAPQTRGADRAVALYHEGRSPSGALTMRLDERPAPAPGAEARTEESLEALTVDEAVTRARRRSARLAELSARAQAAEAATEAAGQYNNPELQISQFRLDQWLADRSRLRTTVRFRPNRPGEIDARVAEARAAAAEAQALLRAEELAMEAEVRWLFDDALLLEAEVAAAEKSAQARRGLAARMKERLDAGESTSIDATMAELSAVEAERDAAERRAQRDAARAELFDRVGLDPGAGASLAGDLLAAWPPPDLPSEQALVEAALRSSARISIAAARIDGADARSYLEHSKRYPWFTSVDLGYSFAPEVPAGQGWVLGVGLELPLFHTNRAGAQAADALAEAERRALAAEAERLAREVRSKLREATAARALVGDFRDLTARAAHRADLEAQRSLEGRSIDVVRALALEERRLLAETRLLRSVRRYRAAVADLRRAVGGKLPEGP